jgi:TolA-binding protein
MTTTPDESADSQALAGLTSFYLEKMEPPTQAELERGLDSFRARVGSAKTRNRRLVLWSLASATVLVVVAAIAISRKPLPDGGPTPLSYRVDGGRVVEGGYLRASGDAGMNVLFNEGSSVALTAGTRGQIRAVDGEGAHVAIERGTASFQVVPSSKRRWLVDVGPFLVTVKGTAFTVSWNPLSEQLDLRLGRGRVVVSGPVSAGEIALRAGQRLLVNLATVETMITEDRPEQRGGEPIGAAAPEPANPPAVEPPVASPGGLDRSASPAPSVTAKTPGERRWSDELARGHWDRILKEVDRAGVEVTLGRVSSDDLFILADAARYRRRHDLARAALLAQRRRFPDSPRALDAIFLLGRVDELHRSGTTRAIAWYDEYLQRAPKGPLVGEALGRKMTLTDRLEGSDRARPVAEEYVRRFPKGSYAEYARGLVSAP